MAEGDFLKWVGAVLEISAILRVDGLKIPAVGYSAAYGSFLPAGEKLLRWIRQKLNSR